jgi:hypothetical protein
MRRGKHKRSLLAQQLLQGHSVRLIRSESNRGGRFHLLHTPNLTQMPPGSNFYMSGTADLLLFLLVLAAFVVSDQIQITLHQPAYCHEGGESGKEGARETGLDTSERWGWQSGPRVGVPVGLGVGLGAVLHPWVCPNPTNPTRLISDVDLDFK